MKKIVDYKLVIEDSPYDLAEAVTKQLDMGWQPYKGPISSKQKDRGRVWIQAMVMVATPHTPAQGSNAFFDEKDGKQL